MKRLATLVLLFFLLMASGCECLSGFGRDMQKAGEWVEEKAEKAEKAR